MICIYEKTTSDFNNNGLGTLEPIECTFKPIINNVWSLEMILPYDAEGKSQFIANDRILKVTDIDCISEQTSDYQLFRIYGFKKEDNFVSVIAYPIGLDARFDTFVDSVKMDYKTASQAIAQMNSLSSKYTVSGSGYNATVKSAEYVNTNLFAILNGENSFVQVWDGEICYDNYNIRVNHRLGSSSNPLDVRYGKNITGMSYDMDASNIITQLYPKSKDNYPLNINNRNYVNASNFADYPIPHMYYIQAPFNLVQLSNDGSEEYLMSIGIFDHIKTLTAEWLNKALSNDEIYGGLLKEIELDWINNNYDLTTIHDGVQGIVEYLWRKLISSSHANITHGAVQSLVYNAMKAGFDDVLKNSDSGYYIGSASKKLMDSGFGTQFYSYEWDTVGDYRVTPDGEGYVWVYASSKWYQLDTNGETTGATDKTKWKWYKVKGQSYKRYGNKKKKRYLKSQWWKINDVWYWYGSNGKSNKGSALTSMYYEYFEDAEIMLDGKQQTIYDVLSDVCSNGESRLVRLLNNQMEQYCLNLFENEKLSYPTVKLDINMVDLSQTTEYKDFQSLERIHLGDSVKVYNPRLGIESTVRVIGLTYDVLRKMNTEIQIGVTETSVINLLNNIGKGSDEVRYVAGDGITIENNTISVIPPTKPYLEDVLLNGESVVRNHKAYIDTDELEGIGLQYFTETENALYGEDESIDLAHDPELQRPQGSSEVRIELYSDGISADTGMIMGVTIPPEVSVIFYPCVYHTPVMQEGDYPFSIESISSYGAYGGLIMLSQYPEKLYASVQLKIRELPDIGDNGWGTPSLIRFNSNYEIAQPFDCEDPRNNSPAINPPFFATSETTVNGETWYGMVIRLEHGNFGFDACIWKSTQVYIPTLETGFQTIKDAMDTLLLSSIIGSGKLNGIARNNGLAFFAGADDEYGTNAKVKIYANGKTEGLSSAIQDIKINGFSIVGSDKIAKIKTINSELMGENACLVPIPTHSDKNKYLKGDGTWSELLDDYIRDEIIVGKWLNGKYIYRRILTPNTTLSSLNEDISSYGIEELIKIYAMFDDGGDKISSLCTNAEIKKSNDSLVGSGNYGIDWIAIEYTKLNDIVSDLDDFVDDILSLQDDALSNDDYIVVDSETSGIRKYLRGDKG